MGGTTEAVAESTKPKSSFGDDAAGCLGGILFIGFFLVLPFVGAYYLWENHWPWREAPETPLETCQKGVAFPGLRPEDARLLNAWHADWRRTQEALNAAQLKEVDALAEEWKAGAREVGDVSIFIEAQRTTRKATSDKFRKVLNDFCVGAVARRQVPRGR